MTKTERTLQTILKLNLEGNVIPHAWFKTLVKKTEKGKTVPHVHAILLLSEIVYWWRPSIERDEISGKILGMRKKFRGEAPQISYQQLSERFGISKRQVKMAMDFLEDVGVIKREFRTVKTPNGKIPNVLFIWVDAETLMEITYPTKICRISRKGASQEAKIDSELTEICKTNTEITTENTTEITERDINRELPREEKSEPPKEVNLEKREQAGGGKPFDAVKESQPATSANRLPKQLYISPHAKQIVNAFKDQFLTKFGIPPTITTKAVQELEAILSRLSDTEKFAFVQRAAGAIERYLKSEEPFLKKAGYSFQVFVSTMQKYMIEEKKEERQKSERKDGIIEEMDL